MSSRRRRGEDCRRCSPFPSASEDRRHARRPGRRLPQTRSPSYRLAYDDPAFLARDELRGIRLALEYEKPALILEDAGIDETIVIFGSARAPADDDAQAAGDPRREDYRAARRLAQLISAHRRRRGSGPVVMTGGGPGIMEAGNRGAADAGAPSIGLNIVIPHEQLPNAWITPKFSFLFHYFAIRKMHFLLRARALVFFPGGFGTLDELFETLTLLQTGRLRPTPVLLYRRAFWDAVIGWDRLVDEGMIDPADRGLVRHVESAEEAFAALVEAGVLAGPERR